MFCPQCRVEYREGFSECADCHVPLLPEPPPEPQLEPDPRLEPDSSLAPESEMALVAVFETQNPIVLALAKGILEDAGVPFVVRGERVLGIPGGGFGFGASSALPSRIEVQRGDQDRATELLSHFEEEHEIP